MENRPDRSEWWERAIVFLVFAVAVFLLVPTAADPDLWGHVRFGLDFLETGSLDRYDPYAYTSVGHEWINHEWMSEILLAGVYRAAGSRGLLLFKLAVGLLIVGLLYLHLRRKGLDALRGGILLIPVVLLMTPGLVTVRPQLFTFLFLALLLLLLDLSETRHPRAIWLAPLVLAVWINFHGGVLAGLGVLGVWMGGRWISALAARGPEDRPARRRAAWRASGAFLLGAAALLVNPYGWELPAFLLRTATVPRPDISEWVPTPIFSGRGIVYLVLVVASLVALHWSRARRRPAPLLAWAALAILPLSAVRHLQLFAIGVPILLAPHFASAAAALPSGSRDSARSAARLRGTLIGACFAVGAIMLTSVVPRFRCVEIDAARTIPFPVRAVAWLERSGVEGNLATYFDWGEYALWHLAPEIRVSMDGRRETVYPDTIYEEYLRFQNGLGEWDDHIEEPPADMVLFSTGRPTYNLLRLAPGWELLYEDSLAAVFAPPRSRSAARLRSTPLPAEPERGIGLCAP